jgi:short-subunit dehydrogenase
MTRQMARYFHVRGGGRIVNISSIGGKIALPHMAAYTASKFALAGFSRALASELAPHNITVTTVYPGLMRTGSPIQAVFKGDQQKEFAVFTAMDTMPGISMSASRAARQIVEACRQGDVEAVLGWPAKLGAFVYENFPEITGAAFKLATMFLPTGHSHERRTGAESQNLFNQLSWMKPLRALDERARSELNQKEKGNADFNLGVDS